MFVGINKIVGSYLCFFGELVLESDWDLGKSEWWGGSWGEFGEGKEKVV